MRSIIFSTLVVSTIILIHTTRFQSVFGGDQHVQAHGTVYCAYVPGNEESKGKNNTPKKTLHTHDKDQIDEIAADEASSSRRRKRGNPYGGGYDSHDEEHYEEGKKRYGHGRKYHRKGYRGGHYEEKGRKEYREDEHEYRGHGPEEESKPSWLQEQEKPSGHWPMDHGQEKPLSWGPGGQNWAPSEKNWSPVDQNWAPPEKNWSPAVGQNWAPPEKNWSPVGQNWAPPENNWSPGMPAPAPAQPGEFNWSPVPEAPAPAVPANPNIWTPAANQAIAPGWNPVGSGSAPIMAPGQFVGWQPGKRNRRAILTAPKQQTTIEKPKKAPVRKRREAPILPPPEQQTTTEKPNWPPQSDATTTGSPSDQEDIESRSEWSDDEGEGWMEVDPEEWGYAEADWRTKREETGAHPLTPPEQQTTTEKPNWPPQSDDTTTGSPSNQEGIGSRSEWSENEGEWMDIDPEEWDAEIEWRQKRKSVGQLKATAERPKPPKIGVRKRRSKATNKQTTTSRKRRSNNILPPLKEQTTTEEPKGTKPSAEGTADSPPPESPFVQGGNESRSEWSDDEGEDWMEVDPEEWGTETDRRRKRETADATVDVGATGKNTSTDNNKDKYHDKDGKDTNSDGDDNKEDGTNKYPDKKDKNKEGEKNEGGKKGDEEPKPGKLPISGKPDESDKKESTDELAVENDPPQTDPDPESTNPDAEEPAVAPPTDTQATNSTGSEKPSADKTVKPSDNPASADEAPDAERGDWEDDWFEMDDNFWGWGDEGEFGVRRKRGHKLPIDPYKYPLPQPANPPQQPPQKDDNNPEKPETPWETPPKIPPPQEVPEEEPEEFSEDDYKFVPIPVQSNPEPPPAPEPPALEPHAPEPPAPEPPAPEPPALEPHAPEPPAPEPVQEPPPKLLPPAKNPPAEKPYAPYYHHPYGGQDGKSVQRRSVSKLAFAAPFAEPKDQKGKLADGIKIQLYEQDTFNFDDELATVETDKHGKFKISGSQNELNYLRPYLYITHSCPSQFVANKNCRFVNRIDLDHYEINSTHSLGEIVLGGTRPYDKVICD